VESSVFPIPPDVALIPMVLAKRDKAWLYATICTVASVLGGAFGYAVGYFLFDTLGQYILNLYGYQQAYESFSENFNAWGIWIVLIAGFTPFPFKVITIASGVTHLNFAIFMLVSLFARGARFYLVAGLLWWFGPPIKNFIDRYFGILSFAFIALLLGGFLVAGMML